MSNSYAVEQTPNVEVPEVIDYKLISPENFSISFAPGAGMVGCSMLHDGEELLGMRGGLAKYIATGSTFGIPLLAPWANRLEVQSFEGVELVLDGTPGVKSDGNDLPIHGLLAGCPDWVVTRFEGVDSGDDIGAWLVAELDFNSARPEFPAWPFPFKLAVSVHVTGTQVEVTTALTATGDRNVPVAFGWHPYFAPPGGDRADWSVAKPFVHHVELDDRCVPTGVVDRVPVEIDTLGDPSADGITFDDLFCEVPAGTKAWVEGGRRRITMTYESGYPYAVLFAPPEMALVAIEPMSAPTDPLSGKFPIRFAAPGETVAGVFVITVTQSGVNA